ncbi:hypothetical protein C8Q73DRAFT_695840 [Cubamyces lactineus]|nr:hypothetical protein C8Q73DRAFT_695840 [Cubamyces lactineus]
MIDSKTDGPSTSALPLPLILDPPRSLTGAPKVPEGLTMSRMPRAGVTTIRDQLASCEAALQQSGKEIAAYREIVESQNATLALQAAAFEVQQRKLTEKNDKKRSSRDKLLAKKVGRHLSGEEFRAAVRADEATREATKAKKDASKVSREAMAQIRRERRAWRKDEQENRRKQRAQDLAAWETESKRCREAHEKLPKLPAAPKRLPTPDGLKSPEQDEHREKESGGEGQESGDESRDGVTVESD